MKVELERKKLFEWIKLEDIRIRIAEAAKDKDYDKVSDLIVSYILAASRVPMEIDWRDLSWADVIGAYIEALVLNTPRKMFPIMRATGGEKHPYDYEGRDWYGWVNLFASHYGWKVSDIAELDIDDAIGLMQEIKVDEQRQMEWEWMRTEIAYPYDSNSKSSRYQPLPTPSWMQAPKPAMPKRFKIRKDLMPPGWTDGTQRKDN